MIPRVGGSANEIPIETQMLLLEARQGSSSNDGVSVEQNSEFTFYILALPVLDGPFRTSLQGNAVNELLFCAESGDVNVTTTEVAEAVFINYGDNPFDLITDSIKILAKHKGTFSHIDDKMIPPHLDWFGWCTWDAFYSKVNPRGIKEGLQSFLEGGCSPRFVIIDDGWQDTENEFYNDGKPIVEGMQFATRLVDIKENEKFRSSVLEDSCADLHELINFIKQKYGLNYVYLWHALAGYWGGLHPASEKMKKYNPQLVYPIQSPGNLGNLRDIAMDSLEKYGVGVIDPEKIYDFYNDLHSYLARCGVDGVKVDVQNLIETLGNGCGGRVTLTRRYQEALDRSVERNFKENNLICCMSHNSDSIYSSKKSAVARASEDFMPREQTFQTLHVASVAYNSLLLGEIFVSDWDMFHSKHETAEFHGAARALGGCAVYVSDKAANHDFNILKKLVLPDGSVLRARYAGRPTRDCLFEDPVMDGKSLLKTWNVNKLTGVIGVFNCQGAGSWPLKQDLREKSSSPLPMLPPISGHISPADVEFLEEIVGENWDGDCAVYAFNKGSLSRLSKRGNLEVSLKTLECEIYTISPIRVFLENIHFAAIGLLDMYNSGGAVQAIKCTTSLSVGIITVKGRGCGRFGFYTTSKPNCCKVDNKEGEFTYNDQNNMLTVNLPEECKLRDIEIVY
ncbi:probable galactinol--sucrose galactosyltransferase 2 isoform X2 [Rhodamnia argentea]|nr:probable galactinol--sucrose galactosyltransferase 2 isoform X2 [Rhodamnia argentea]